MFRVILGSECSFVEELSGMFVLRILDQIDFDVIDLDSKKEGGLQSGNLDTTINLNIALTS